MTEPGVKTSMNPTDWQNEHQEYESVHTDQSTHPSIRLAPSSYLRCEQKYI